MRIRKNAKHSQLLGTNSTCSPSPVPQAIICKLNQSRWDVQVDEDFNVIENDDSLNPTGVAKKNSSSAAPSEVLKKGKWHAANPTEVSKSTTSLKACGKRKRRAANAMFPKDTKNKDMNTGLEQKGKSKIIVDDLVLCPELDKSGWQCGRPVEHGLTMCKDHVELTSFLEESNISTPDTNNTSDVIYYGGYNGPSAARRGATDRASSSTSGRMTSKAATKKDN